MLRRKIDLRNADFDRKAIGFWMEADGKVTGPVRVLVTYEALAQLDPQQVRDLDGALTTFDKNRARIDAAASIKFDASDDHLETDEGRPLIILHDHDLS